MNLSERNLLQPRRYRVLFIIEKHESLSQLRNKITRSHSFEVIGEANCATEGVLLTKLCQPDVLLISSRLIEFQNKDMLESIRNLVPSCQILHIVDETQILNQPHAHNTSANGTITINTSVEILYAKLLKSQNPIQNHGLTSREKEILSLLATGQCNKLIGRALNISEGTVKVHVKHILKKLKLRSRLEAAVWILAHSNHTELSLS